MATPNDRRIVYGTFVVPQIAFNTTSTEVTREEGSTAGTAAYEDWKLDNVWNLDSTIWNHEGLEVTDDLATIRSGSDGVKFLYIKNTGTVECELALEGDERDILIPSGASVSMRTNSSSVTSATVKVATAASSGNTTTIEYVIAI